MRCFHLLDEDFQKRAKRLRFFFQAMTNLSFNKSILPTFIYENGELSPGVIFALTSEDDLLKKVHEVPGETTNYSNNHYIDKREITKK